MSVRTFAFAVVVLVASSLTPAAAQGCNEAVTFVSGVGKQVTDIVANASLSSNQRLSEFRRVFRANADFVTMGRVALGRWWNKLPEAQRPEYYQLIENLIVRVMFGRLNEFAGERYAIEARTCRPKGTKGREFLVDGPVLKAGGGSVTDVRWWVIRKSNGQLRVLDVSIAGISLTIQKREEFDAFILKSARRIDPLLQDLRRRAGS